MSLIRRIDDIGLLAGVEAAGASGRERNLLLAKRIIDDQRTNRYVGYVCEHVRRVFEAYQLDMKVLCAESKNSAGQVHTKYVDEVIRDGNIRERMTLLMNLSRGNQEYLWKLMQSIEDNSLPPSIKSLINADVIRRRIERVSLLTGIMTVREMTECIKDFRDGSSTGVEASNLPARFADLTHDGAVMVSRLGAFPMVKPLRIEREKSEMEKYRMQVKDVFPELSHREVEFIQADNPSFDPNSQDAPMPWVTGQMYWVLKPDCFYAKLGRRYNQHMVAGPSGNTDGNMEIFELFNDFTAIGATMACLAWMANTEDHSAFEILLGAAPFLLEASKLAKIDITRNAYDTLTALKALYKMPLQSENYDGVGGVV